MKISILPIDVDEASKLHQTITKDLPEFFGLPEANQKYSQGIAQCHNLAISVGGEYIGMIALNFPYPNNASIYWMGILKNAQGKGFGKRLLQGAEEFALKYGAKTLTVETLSPNVENKLYLGTYKFYEACGFSPLFDLKPGRYDWEMVYMVKALNPSSANDEITISDTPQIIFETDPSPLDLNILLDGICTFAEEQKGLDPIETFAFIIKDSVGKTLGGCSGITYYGCLYVDLLWVDPQLRGQGWGTKLMAKAEAHGRQKQCTMATVNTMDWEAKDLYGKLGYVQEFVREGYAKDSSHYFMKKEL